MFRFIVDAIRLYIILPELRLLVANLFTFITTTEYCQLNCEAFSSTCFSTRCCIRLTHRTVSFDNAVPIISVCSSAGQEAWFAETVIDGALITMDSQLDTGFRLTIVSAYKTRRSQIDVRSLIVQNNQLAIKIIQHTPSSPFNTDC